MDQPAPARDWVRHALLYPNGLYFSEFPGHVQIRADYGHIVFIAVSGPGIVIPQAMLFEVSIPFPFELTAKNSVVEQPGPLDRSNNGVTAVYLAEITIIFRQHRGNLVHLARLVWRADDEKYSFSRKHGIPQHTDSLKVYH
jgi:hypothetical protein